MNVAFDAPSFRNRLTSALKQIENVIPLYNSKQIEHEEKSGGI